MKKVILLGSMVLMALNATGTFANDSQTVTVIAIVKVKPGTEDAFKEAAQKIIVPTREETGNIRYEFNQSTQDPSSFATSEIWTSDGAVQAHMNSPHMKAFFSAVGSDFESGYPQINEYTQISPSAENR